MFVRNQFQEKVEYSIEETVNYGLLNIMKLKTEYLSKNVYMEKLKKLL